MFNHSIKIAPLYKKQMYKNKCEQEFYYDTERNKFMFQNNKIYKYYFIA